MEYPNPGVRTVSFGVQGRFSGAQSTRHDEQECLCAVYAEQAIPLLVALRDFIADVIALRGFRANKDIVLPSFHGRGTWLSHPASGWPNQDRISRSACRSQTMKVSYEQLA